VGRYGRDLSWWLDLSRAYRQLGMAASRRPGWRAHAAAGGQLEPRRRLVSVQVAAGQRTLRSGVIPKHWPGAKQEPALGRGDARAANASLRSGCEAERTSDRKRGRDALRRCRVPDHHVDLVRLLSEGGRRGCPASRETLRARSPHGSHCLERPAPRFDSSAAARRGLPADDHNHGSVRRHAIGADLALRGFGCDAWGADNQKCSRICDRAVTRSRDPMPACWDSDGDTMSSHGLFAARAGNGCEG
jgi:hypothetical protein